jgi:hypothetical protein
MTALAKKGKDVKKADLINLFNVNKNTNQSSDANQYQNQG